MNNLVNLDSNNEIYNTLYVFSGTLKKISHAIPKNLIVIETVRTVLAKSKKLKKEPQQTEIGELPGWGYSDVAKVCLDILESLMFVFPKETLVIVMELSLSKDQEIKSKALDVSEHISKCIVLQSEEKIYYEIQLLILDEVEKLDNVNLIAHFDFVVIISKQLLELSFCSVQRDGAHVKKCSGMLPGSELVKTIRERTFVIVQKMYDLTATISDKKKILNILELAFHIPYHLCCPPELKQIILENLHPVICLYTSILQTEEYALIMMIDEQTKQWNTRFPDNSELTNLQSRIEVNDNYHTYKFFAGYDDCDLEHTFSFKQNEENIKQRIHDFVSNVAENNFSYWQQRILFLAKNYTPNGEHGKFDRFREFLTHLGIKKPNIAQKLLSENEIELEYFLVDLVAGIWESTDKENAKKILEIWIEKGKYLSTCACILERVTEIDESLLCSLYKKAKQQNDINVFLHIIYALANQSEKKTIKKDLFITCFNELKTHINPQWLRPIVLRSPTILTTLNEKDWKIILNSLINILNIDLYIEKFLLVAAQKFPKLLICFFYDRVNTNKENKEMRYTAIPVTLNELKKPLSEQADIVISEILKGFKEDNAIALSAGGRLLQAIFPAFHPTLEIQLIELLDSKHKNKVNIILRILYAYEGQPFLHPVCKRIIEHFPKKQEYWKFVSDLLSKTGVIQGQYGYVEAYEQKKQEIQPWHKDTNKSIKKFATQHEKALAERITWDKKRADKRVEIANIN